MNPIASHKIKKPKIPVNKERLQSDVEKLTSIHPPRNYQNLSSLNQTADYILNEFKKLDGNVDVQNFIVKGKEYKNIITSFGPREAQRLIIGAHYDVCGDQPGADDNASGVAGLLELARLINELKPTLNHRVDFVAYSLEEPPFFRTKFMGSAVHAKSLGDANVKLMISLEMIGFFSEEKNSQKFFNPLLKLYYPNKGNFIVIVGKIGQSKIVRRIKKHMIEGSSIDVRSINAPSFLPAIDFSDHRNYWKRGYKAVMLTDTAFYRNPNYHKKTDTIETLNFDKMAEVVKGVYQVIVSF